MQVSYASYMPKISYNYLSTVPSYMYSYLVSHAYLVMSLWYTYPACMAQCSTEYFSFYSRR